LNDEQSLKALQDLEIEKLRKAKEQELARKAEEKKEAEIAKKHGPGGRFGKAPA